MRSDMNTGNVGQRSFDAFGRDGEVQIEISTAARLLDSSFRPLVDSSTRRNSASSNFSATRRNNISSGVINSGLSPSLEERQPAFVVKLDSFSLEVGLKKVKKGIDKLFEEAEMDEADALGPRKSDGDSSDDEVHDGRRSTEVPRKTQENPSIARNSSVSFAQTGESIDLEETPHGKTDDEEDEANGALLELFLNRIIREGKTALSAKPKEAREAEENPEISFAVGAGVTGIPRKTLCEKVEIEVEMGRKVSLYEFLASQIECKTTNLKGESLLKDAESAADLPKVLTAKLAALDMMQAEALRVKQADLQSLAFSLGTAVGFGLPTEYPFPGVQKLYELLLETSPPWLAKTIGIFGDSAISCFTEVFDQAIVKRSIEGRRTGKKPPMLESLQNAIGDGMLAGIGSIPANLLSYFPDLDPKIKIPLTFLFNLIAVLTSGAGIFADAKEDKQEMKKRIGVLIDKGDLVVPVVKDESGKELTPKAAKEKYINDLCYELREIRASDNLSQRSIGTMVLMSLIVSTVESSGKVPEPLIKALRILGFNPIEMTAATLGAGLSKLSIPGLATSDKEKFDVLRELLFEKYYAAKGKKQNSEVTDDDLSVSEEEILERLLPVPTRQYQAVGEFAINVAIDRSAAGQMLSDAWQKVIDFALPKGNAEVDLRGKSSMPGAWFEASGSLAGSSAVV